MKLKKTISNKRVCELIKAMEEDESKATKEYDEVISLVREKHPEIAGELEIMLGDEISHQVKLTDMSKKLKCD